MPDFDMLCKRKKKWNLKKKKNYLITQFSRNFIIFERVRERGIGCGEIVDPSTFTNPS
jgi:hypothetical protein